MKTGALNQQQPPPQKMGMEIERRLLLRLSGEEAESLASLLNYAISCAVEHNDQESAVWYGALYAKIQAGLGRSERLAKVLQENPPNHMKPHPAKCECQDCLAEREE